VLAGLAAAAGAYERYPEFRLTYERGPAQNAQIAVIGDSVHVFWLDGRDRDGSYEVLYTRTFDEGLTWRPVRQLTDVDWRLEGLDLAVRGSTIQLLYKDHRSAGPMIMLLTSTDAGATWSGPRRVDAAGDAEPHLARIAYGPGGTLHLVYWHLGLGASNVFYRRSTDHGATWGPEVAVSDPSMAVDSSMPGVAELPDGTVCVVWVDSRFGWPQGGFPPNEVLFTTSQDGGRSFSLEPRPLSALLPRDESDCYDPAIVVDDNGVIHVTWWEARDGNQLYYTQSRDGGYEFSAPRAISALGPGHPLEEIFGAGTASLIARDEELCLVFASHFRAGKQTPSLLQGDVYQTISTDGGRTWGPLETLAASAAARGPRAAWTAAGPWVVYADERDNHAGEEAVGEEIYLSRSGRPYLPQQSLVLLAGYGWSHIEEGEGGTLSILAAIQDPSGGSEPASVELAYQGEPVGLFLEDDGQHGDFEAGDGVYGLTLELGPGVPAGEYLLELIVRDTAGNVTIWPYLEIGEPEQAYAAPPRIPSWTAESAALLTRGDGPPLRPHVLYAGYWTTRLGEGLGRDLVLKAVLDDPRGRNYVREVELRHDGELTGIMLSDEGPAGATGDEVADDGIYTFAVRLDPADLAGLDLRLLLGLEARDALGWAGHWPELMVDP
jgi:hypothetical protein